MNPQYSRYYTRLQPIMNNKKVKTYSHIVFSLVTIIIFALFAIRPTVKTILSLKNTINEQTEILRQLKQKNADIESGISAYDHMDTDTKIKLYTLLPSSTSVTCMINEFNFLSSTNQVAISGLQFQPTALIGLTKCQLTADDLGFYRANTTKETGVKEVSFTLNTQGDYPQLVNVLTELSKQSRLTSIDSVSFTQPPEGNLIMIINGKAYFYK